jgi:predicted AlkP superfamily pyrophosphatase or phosphodiesterase
MRADYLTDADGHDLKIPVLRQLAREGSFATGVVGVLPTLTYPSHTTLLTGVWPVRHGIGNNYPFDPAGDNDDGSYWYAEDIHAETLWEAADRAGITVASLAWPVGVAAPGVHYLIPEYGKGSTDDVKAIRALSRPFELLPRLEAELGTIYVSQDEEEGDAVRTRFAEAILRRYKPGFMTVHLVGLDGRSHEHGPFSSEADAALEAIDAMVGRLRDAALASDPETVVAVVSDHGFLPVDHRVKLTPAFVAAGLIRLDAAKAHIRSWDAAPWSAGGSVVIKLARRDDAALQARVRTLLTRLAADPANGIAAVIDRTDAAARGGTDSADFWVNLRPGYAANGGLTGPLAEKLETTRGAHGYFPDNSGLYASFIIAGRGMAHRGSLGVIDMRAIAPTLAGILGVPLPGAEVKAIDLADR